MRVRIIAEVEGLAIAFSNSSDTTGLSWATTALPVIRTIPNPSPITANFLTGESDAGGFSLEVADISALLNDLSVSEVTALNGDLNNSATSVVLVDASTLPSSGTIFVNKEAITYASKTSNTLNGCTRGVLGTQKSGHFDGDLVFSEFTGLYGKRIFLKWKTDSTDWVRSTGVIDSVEWDGAGYRLIITSPQLELLEHEVMSLSYSKLKGRIVGRNSSEEVLLLNADSVKEASLFASRIADSNSQYGVLLKTDTKVFSLSNSVTYPAIDKPITAFTGGSKLIIWDLNQPADGVLEVGDYVEIWDSSGNILASDLFVNKKPLGIGYAYLSGDLSSYTYTAGDRLVTPSKIGVFLKNGATGIEGLGEDVDLEEIRYIRGNFITDILLPLITSTGTGVNGAYDILPKDWGCGFSSVFVDTSGLEALESAFLATRTYYFDGATPLLEMITAAGASVGVLFYFNQNGVFTGRRIGDLFPNDQSLITVDRGRLLDKTIPSIRTGFSDLKNSFVFETDWDPVKKIFKNQIIANDLPSISRYGRRVYTISDRGLVKSLGTPSLGLKLLRFYSLPYPVITCRIRYEVGDAIMVGDFVALDVEHLPDMRGSTGINGTLFRVEGVTFNDSEGSFDLTLRGLSVARTGLIAPSGKVLSKSTTEITLETSATTKFSPTTSYGSPIPVHNAAGTEDCDWFLEGDKITLWDVSTLGGTPTTSDHTVNSVDYATRTLTLTPNVPAWVGVGDLVRLSKTAAFSGGATRDDRDGVFVALTNIALAGFDAYLWGV